MAKSNDPQVKVLDGEGGGNESKKRIMFEIESFVKEWWARFGQVDEAVFTRAVGVDVKHVLTLYVLSVQRLDMLIFRLKLARTISARFFDVRILKYWFDKRW